MPKKATILITYYNPARMIHMNHQIRNIFKCDFVDKVIISNHNPDIQINSLIEVKDKRLVIKNQKVRHGCGFRWVVAEEFAPEYLIVIDDDILLFPWQLASLFKHLVFEPGVPHGFAGMVHREDDMLEYHEMEERSVDYICEIYAITGEHLKQYKQLRDGILSQNNALARLVEYSADFMIISKTGYKEPWIHKTDRLFRCPTYNEAGVAVHKEFEFQESVLDVARALR